MAPAGAGGADLRGSGSQLPGAGRLAMTNATSGVKSARPYASLTATRPAPRGRRRPKHREGFPGPEPDRQSWGEVRAPPGRRDTRARERAGRALPLTCPSGSLPPCR